MHNLRWLARLFLVLTLSCGPLAPLRAQSDNTAAQRASYGRAFRAEGTDAAAPVTATVAELGDDRGNGITQEQRASYARAFAAMLDLQERRTALPAAPEQLHDYVMRINSEMMAATAVAPPPPGLQYLLHWNHLALDATAIDHSTLQPSFGEQLGPVRTSRALAITHLAMFEAVNAIHRTKPSYRGVQTQILTNIGLPDTAVTPATASVDRAIIEAAYRTLKDVYPKKDATFLEIAYRKDLENLGDIPAPMTGNRPADMILGEAVGKQAADLILALRHFDGSELPDLSSDDFRSSNPNRWRQDPISKVGPAIGGNWHRVKPFLLDRADAFRPVPPPAFGTPDFIAAYKEVKRLGGDPNAPIDIVRWPTRTDRTGHENPNMPVPPYNANQTFVGIYWAYDGTALLCAPPRLYNMIATSVALQERPITSVVDFSQYLALINVAMADAGIAAWEAKYYYLYPRPITYLRAVDADGTPEGAKNEHWTPLGAPITNGTAEGRNLTPPFPAYPSGHAVFGATLFRSMARFYQQSDAMFPDDGIPFTFVSDEYNGLNRGPGETVNRERIEASFASFKEAEELNAISRIYLGIHWRFDAEKGIEQGHAVGADVSTKFLTPAP